MPCTMDDQHKRLRQFITFLFVSVLTAAGASGQTTNGTAFDRPTFFTNAEKVPVCRNSESVPGYILRSVTVTVIERKSGRRIGNLKGTDFSILQGDEEIPIAGFKRWNSPLSVVLAIDTSASTANQLGDIGRAADTIVGGLSLNDRLSVITFDGQVTQVLRPQSVRDLSGKAIRVARSSPGTRLFDAVDVALKTSLKESMGRRVVIVLTDGEDNSSKNASEWSTVWSANEANVFFYALQYPYGDSFRVSTHPYLKLLADATGGKVLRSSELSKSAEQLLAILDEAAAQYTFCYWTAEQDIGEDVRIKLRRSNTNYAIRVQAH